MRDTTIYLQRPEGTTLYTGIAIQADQVSTQEMIKADITVERGAVYYKLVSFWPMVLTHFHRGDVLYDELFIDPITNAAYKYRVVGVPKMYADHDECYAKVIQGA